MHFEFNLRPGVTEKRMNVTSNVLYRAVGSTFATDKMADLKTARQERTQADIKPVRKKSKTGRRSIIHVERQLGRQAVRYTAYTLSHSERE